MQFLTRDNQHSGADEGGRALVACHNCDALLYEAEEHGFRARCPRCNSVLTTGREGAIDRVLAASVMTISLILCAMFLPFLTIEVAGQQLNAAVFDAVIAAGENAWPLAIAVGILILGLPICRSLALIWILAPVRMGYRPLPLAKPAFRFVIEMRQWSMVEVFVIGVVVALVKIIALATVGLGEAFWLFIALSAVAVMEDISLCRRSVWRLLG